MRTPLRSPLRFVLAAAAVVLTVSACGVDPGQTTAGPTGAKGGRSEASEPAVALAQVDPNLVMGLTPTTYTDDERNVRAEVPMISSARQMTAAMEVLRERSLREASWEDASEVRVGYQVVAAGAGTLGIVVTPSWKSAAGETTKPALVWYDAASKKVFSSPVLIRPDQWGSFKAEVAKAADKNKKIDQARLSQALDSAAAPQGNGPMLGFDASGAMVVQFAPKVVTEQAVALKVPTTSVEGLLSDYGRRAATAAARPVAFDGTPAPAETANPVPAAPAATPVAARPSTAVGPDCAVETCVALTYDDGPGSGTPELVASLRQAKAPATFFQLGEMIKANPDIAKEVASGGHEVASHTISHPNLTKLGAERLTRELAGNAEIMEQAYGRKPMLMRPPYGAHNKTVAEAVRGTGAAIIQWDVDTNDWKTKSTPSTENSVVYGGGAESNSIVLMHDIHASTVAAAPAILEGLQQKDVTLVTVSELSLNSNGYQAGRAYCNGTAKESQNGFDCNA